MLLYITTHPVVFSYLDAAFHVGTKTNKVVMLPARYIRRKQMGRNEDTESFQEGLMTAWVGGKSFVPKVVVVSRRK